VRLVLASRSPRRADLLTAAGYAFDVAPADIDERHHEGESPHDYVERLAAEKADRVGAAVPGAVVLGADTVVVIDALVLGKPVDDADAAAMLQRLSGRSHEVLTGVAIQAPGCRRRGVAVTRVVFRTLTPADVEWYIESGEPTGKAGGYAIQGRASRFVTHIEGSYSNVVGLPMALVDRLLRTVVNAR
jgi:septum formation protein